MGFTVDRERHLYALHRVPLDSVTDILQELGVVDPTYYNETGKIRGGKVHLGTALLERPGGLDWESLKPIEDALGEPITPYVRAYERYLRETGWKSQIIEKAYYHPDYLYAGTPDRIGRFPDDKLGSLLDLKTGKSVHPGTALQTGAYDEMVPREGGIPRRRYGVLLKVDGDFILKRFDDHNDGQTFLAGLTLHRWRKNHGITNRKDRYAETA